MSRKALILMVLFSLILIVSSLYVIKTLDPGEKPKPTSEFTNIPANTIVVNTDFKLISDNGKEFNYSNLEGKFTVIHLGFTYCPDICPIILQKLSKLANSFNEAQLDKVQFLFISVDPQRDNLETLRKFVSQFSNKITGITGDKIEIDRLVSSLKGYYAKVDNKEDPDNYYVDHSSFIYLLDPQANLVSQFSSDASIEEIYKRLSERLTQTK